MNTRTTVEVSLTLDSAVHHPDTITAAVGLQPTGTRAGRLNLWAYTRPEVECWDVPTEVGALLDTLMPDCRQIRDGASALGIRPQVVCAVTVGAETPALSWDPTLIRRLTDLGAALVVELLIASERGDFE